MKITNHGDTESTEAEMYTGRLDAAWLQNGPCVPLSLCGSFFEVVR